jgi:hypothetical protein
VAIEVLGRREIAIVRGLARPASKGFTAEKKSEDEELTEKNQYGAARGVRSSTEFSMATPALKRPLREALKTSCFSVYSSSSPSPPY